jgi:hypothetical protein
MVNCSIVTIGLPEDSHNIPLCDAKCQQNHNFAGTETTRQGFQDIELRLLQHRSNGVIMRSAADVPSLKVSLEIIAKLIYLSRRTETHSAHQHGYLGRAAVVIAELRHHPTVEGL